MSVFPPDETPEEPTVATLIATLRAQVRELADAAVAGATYDGHAAVQKLGVTIDAATATIDRLEALCRG